MQGWLDFITKAKRREAATRLSFGAMAARGDPRKLNETVKELARDG